MEIMTTRNVCLTLALIIIISIIYIIVDDRNSDKFLQNGVYVIAKVEDVTGGRGPFTVNVQYSYAGKIIENAFSTYNIKGLRDSVRVKILISKEYPDKYIKYIGLANKQ